MKQFTDSESRTWELALTVGGCKRVKDIVGVDFMALEEGSPSLLNRLSLDIMLVGDIAFALVGPQAETAGVSREQFDSAMDGQSINNAQDALFKELADFFRGLDRPDLAGAVETQEVMIAQAVKEALRRIDTVDPAQVVADAFGSSSTSAPEASE